MDILPTENKPQTKKRVLIFIFFYCIIPLLGGEAFFRYYYYRWNEGLTVPFILFAKPFPHTEFLTDFITASKTNGVIFELRPNIRSLFLKKPFYTNSQGFIGITEYTKQKSPNTYRVIGIGDSFITSWGIDPQQSQLSLLQKRLAEQYPQKKIEIINMGVPGYNTAIEYEVIKNKALAYNPDLIIMEYCGNDMDLPNHIRRTVHAWSYLYFVIDTIVDMYRTKNTFSPLTDSPKAQDNTNRFEYHVGIAPQEYEYMLGQANYLRTMKQVYSITQEKNIPVILVTETSYLLSDVPQIKDVGFDILNMDEAVQHYLSSNNLPQESITLSKYDPHLNTRGHKVYADTLFSYILQKNYVLNNNLSSHKERENSHLGM